MFDIVVEGHCLKCNLPQKKKYDLNYENPLMCDCRCDAVEEALERAKAISDAIDARKANNI